MYDDFSAKKHSTHRRSSAPNGKSKKMLLFIHQNWCGACKNFDKIFKKLQEQSKQSGNENILFVKRYPFVEEIDDGHIEYFPTLSIVDINSNGGVMECDHKFMYEGDRTEYCVCKCYKDLPPLSPKKILESSDEQYIRKRLGL
jgi:hypothetical protein